MSAESKPYRADLESLHVLGLLLRDAFRGFDLRERVRVATLAGHVQDAQAYAAGVDFLLAVGAVVSERVPDPRDRRRRVERFRVRPELAAEVRAGLYWCAAIDADPTILERLLLDALEDEGHVQRGSAPTVDEDEPDDAPSVDVWGTEYDPGGHDGQAAPEDDDDDDDDAEEPEDEHTPTDAERATERAERFGLDPSDMLDGFTRTAWADAYGCAVERAAESYAEEGEDSPEERAERAQWTRPNLSGCALEDCAPERVRGDFRAIARAVLRAVLLGVPEETLRAWGEHTDARRGGSYAVGASLYMDAAGHGCGLEDDGLPRVARELEVPGLPYSGGRACAFGNLDAYGVAPLLDWTDLPDANGEHALPLAEDLLVADVCSTPAGKRSADGAAKACAGLLRAYRAGTLDAEEVLAHADRILGGFGVEEVLLPAPEDGEPGGSLLYVNRGDTYTGTLAFLDDADGERFLAVSWGGVLEDAESERTLCTGETRCAYCGGWTLGGLDAGELDTLDPRATAEECADCGHAAE